MYRGEVVRRRVPAPGSADPISQSDKLKLYIVIIMILCVIISRCYSLLRDFPDQVNLSPSALEACWQDSQPDLHTDHMSFNLLVVNGGILTDAPPVMGIRDFI